jgi:hypothetical protein
MLSLSRRSVQECLESFRRISSDLFERERRISIFGFPRPEESKYPLAPLFLHEIVIERRAGYVSLHEPMMFPSPPDLCRT